MEFMNELVVACANNKDKKNIATPPHQVSLHFKATQNPDIQYTIKLNKIKKEYKFK